VGSSAQSYVRTLQAKLAELGFSVKVVKPVADKITRFAPFCAMAEAGFVSYVDDSAYTVDEQWNKDYFNELEMFDGTRKYKRDQVDATSDAYNTLRTSIQIPNFNMTSYTQQNRFSRD
jgi:predicted phage terminase large subunit-like protein